MLQKTPGSQLNILCTFNLCVACIQGGYCRGSNNWNRDSEKNSPRLGIGLDMLKYILQLAAGTEQMTLSLGEEVHSRKVVGKIYSILKKLCYNRSFPVKLQGYKFTEKGLFRSCFVEKCKRSKQIRIFWRTSEWVFRYCT